MLQRERHDCQILTGTQMKVYWKSTMRTDGTICRYQISTNCAECSGSGKLKLCRELTLKIIYICPLYVIRYIFISALHQPNVIKSYLNYLHVQHISFGSTAERVMSKKKWLFVLSFVHEHVLLKHVKLF